MVEKFTDRGRKVMSLARQEAQRLNSDMIGTEHVLLGLASEEGGVAHKALKVLGIDEAALRKDLERRIKPAAPLGMLGQMPFTPRAKRMIELAGEAPASCQTSGPRPSKTSTAAMPAG
jgi:ATP-dependent Clp protease ATP-binding subunit ClpC